MNRPIVAKFGGTSLSCPKQIDKVLAIIRNEPECRYVIVSAPGSRDSTDPKVTKLLIQWMKASMLGLGANEVQNAIVGRYVDIAHHYKLKFNPVDLFMGLEMPQSEGDDNWHIVLSRGEYAMGKILAEILGWSFHDPAGTILFGDNGKCFVEDSVARLRANLPSNRRCVVPGFYGATIHRKIRTFPFGGSNITASLVSVAVYARAFQNWTDVPGMHVADPNVVPEAAPIDRATFDEVRELAYAGADVFHHDAVIPLIGSGVPLNIRDTNCPHKPGTTVSDSRETSCKSVKRLVGIAGRKGFSSVTCSKIGMNDEVGLVAKILQTFAENGVSFEHPPTTIDTITVVFRSSQLDIQSESEKLRSLKSCLHFRCGVTVTECQQNLALISVVGRELPFNGGCWFKGVLASLSIKILYDNGIGIYFISHSGSTTTVGINESSFARAQVCLHHALKEF